MSTETLSLDNPDFKFLFNHLLNEGGVLREIKNITQKEMEAVYSVAYNFYKAGKSEDAVKFFKFLCFFDHLEKKYWIGFGAALQISKKYKEAIDAYTYATLLDSEDPRPPLYAADCHIALGNQKEAESALTAAIEFSGAKPENKAYKDRAQTLLELLKKSDK